MVTTGSSGSLDGVSFQDELTHRIGTARQGDDQARRKAAGGQANGSDSRDTDAPEETERRPREQMPAWQRSWTSDDYAKMSHYAPLVRFYASAPALFQTPGAGRSPSPGMNALRGEARDNCTDDSHRWQDGFRHLQRPAH